MQYGRLMEVSHFPDENRKISASGIQDGAHGGALDGINHRHLQHVTAAKKDKVYTPEEKKAKLKAKKIADAQKEFNKSQGIESPHGKHKKHLHHGKSAKEKSGCNVDETEAAACDCCRATREMNLLNEVEGRILIKAPGKQADSDHSVSNLTQLPSRCPQAGEATAFRSARSPSLQWPNLLLRGPHWLVSFVRREPDATV